jgi:nucleotide-binding universal stress UspA family protein
LQHHALDLAAIPRFCWYAMCSPAYRRNEMAIQLYDNAAQRGVIVVGIDFSPTSDKAVAAAISLVQQHPFTDVHLVHVAMPRGLPGDHARAHPDVLQLDELLQGVARHYFAQTRTGRSLIVTHLLGGSPPHEIVRLAVDVRASLIVMGTNGLSSSTSLALGSVAERVLRVANCSVLAVRPNGLPLSAEMEPPCPACLDVQKSAPRAELWCERHQKKHIMSRTYFEEPQVFGAGSTSVRHN